jgi:hypothetical protein
VKRTIATSRSEATTTGAVPDSETAVRAQESLPPNEPDENATCAPALPLRSQPEENRFCLTNSFRNGHIDRRIQGAVSLRRFAGTELMMQGGSPTDSGGHFKGRVGQRKA